MDISSIHHSYWSYKPTVIGVMFTNLANKKQHHRIVRVATWGLLRFGDSGHHHHRDLLGVGWSLRPAGIV